MCRLQHAGSIVMLVLLTITLINGVVKHSPLFIIICFAAMLAVCYFMLYRTSLNELREAKNNAKQCVKKQ